jgi:hypothetical protein
LLLLDSVAAVIYRHCAEKGQRLSSDVTMRSAIVRLLALNAGINQLQIMAQ